MKFWKRTALCLALCAALLTGCVPAADTASSAAPTDPLTGQEALWPGQRPVAVTIENETSSTIQWGLSSASLVLEALTEPQSATSLCLVYPAVDAVPQVGPVAAGQDLYWRLLVGQQVLPVQRGGGAFDQNYLATTPCARSMHWKWAPTPSPATPPGPAARCGAPAAMRWPGCCAA